MHLLKNKIINIKVKQLYCLLILSILCFINLNCGKRKPPQPPIERVQQRVSINGTQIGSQIRIVWKMPARNAKDGSLLNISRADIYRLAEPLNSPLSLTQEEFANKSTLIASIPIKDSDFALNEKSYVDQLKFSSQEARLRYSIRFVNSSGQKAAFSNFLIIQPSSRIALNPNKLKALVSQDQVTLSWEAPQTNVDGSKPANILGYNIYRRNNLNALRRLNDKPLNSNSFDDQFFQFGDKYSYFVRTVSNGANGQEVESVNSNSISITPVDTFPPDPPSALTIAASPNNISIFFAVNLETDVVGYKVFRSTNPNQPLNNWTLLTKNLLKTNTFQDTKIQSQIEYFYYLTAVDKFGNESKPSEIVSETGF